MKPVKNLIHLKLDELEEKTKSGIIMQKAWQGPPNTGEILAVGSDVSDYKVGEKIVFNAYALINVSLEGKTDYLLRDSDVLAIL